MQKINKKIWGKSENILEELKYDEAFIRFNTDYRRACPLYRALGKKIHKKKHLQNYGEMIKK